MKILILFLCVSSISARTWRVRLVNNNFSSVLYNETVKDSETNFAVSPFAAEKNLIFIHFWAKGETAEELGKALNIPERNIKQKEKIPYHTFENYDYNMTIINRVYVHENIFIKTSFKATVDYIFRGDIEIIDFTETKKAAEIISTWVENRTEDKIKYLILPRELEDTTVVLTINAISFQAQWYFPFNQNLTRKRNFYKTPTEIVQVDTMLNRNNQRFLFTDSSVLDAKILKIPLKGYGTYMTIFLPNRIDGLKDLEKKIDHVLRTEPTSYARVNMEIPKFKIGSRIRLRKLLDALGLDVIFKPTEADLAALGGGKRNLFLSEVHQKSFLEVNETGIDASTVTSIVIRAPIRGSRDAMETEEFIADHPFIFLIKGREFLFFMGKVTDPSHYN